MTFSLDPSFSLNPWDCIPCAPGRSAWFSAQLKSPLFLTLGSLTGLVCLSYLSRKRLEEAPLMTQSQRDAQMKEKLARYPKVRFCFSCFTKKNGSYALEVGMGAKYLWSWWVFHQNCYHWSHFPFISFFKFLQMNWSVWNNRLNGNKALSHHSTILKAGWIIGFCSSCYLLPALFFEVRRSSGETQHEAIYHGWNPIWSVSQLCPFFSSKQSFPCCDSLGCAWMSAKPVCTYALRESW